MSAPSLDELVARVRDEHPMIANGLITSDDAHRSGAEDALDYIARLPSTARGLDHAIEAFAITSIEFLRLQARFRMTGRYALATAASLQEELYGDAEEMGGYYLDGLAMTYALWPNHAHLLSFLRDEFVPLLPESGKVLEIGPGHGLLGHTVLRHRPGLAYVGLDISGPALDYVRAAFDACGHAGSIDLVQGDATDLGASGIPTHVDALVCCEVLEHVDEPDRILDAVRDRLAPHGHAFLSTVANLEAIDHVYLFDDPDHIRRTIEASGLQIEADLPMRLPGDTSIERVPYNYAAIVRRSS